MQDLSFYQKNYNFTYLIDYDTDKNLSQLILQHASKSLVKNIIVGIYLNNLNESKVEIIVDAIHEARQIARPKFVILCNTLDRLEPFYLNDYSKTLCLKGAKKYLLQNTQLSYYSII